MTSTHFEIRGLCAQVDGQRVVLMQGTNHVATLTFRPSGVYSIVERGRGDAGRLPDEVRGDIEAATAFVLNRAWPHPISHAA